MIQEVALDLVLLVRKEVMWPKESLDFVRIDGDVDAVHFGFFEDDNIVGVVSVFKQNHSFQFRKLAVLLAYQGRGIGTMLVEYAKSYCLQGGGENLWCNARVEKLPFYERMGFRSSGDEFIKNGRKYQVMVLELKKIL